MKHLIYLFSISILLVGCGTPLAPEEFISSPEAATLRSIVDRLITRDFASIEAQLDPALSQSDIQSALEEVANVIPSTPITRTEAVDWSVFAATGGIRTVMVSAEYTFGQAQWIVASAQLTGEPDSYRILGFNLEPLPAPLSEIHAFTLSGKSTIHYLFLIAAVFALGLSLFALVSCARTQGLRRKWLWLLFIAIGFVSFTINWSSGAVHISPFMFRLLSAGFARQGWQGPWMLTFCIPVGALWFMMRQRRAMQNGASAG
ncbi:MAG: hypothetical protein LBG44_05370 [Gemmatimonadota bacterium]|jgi:hypothetical protein|nr:hypothetical protein [Gemmatimonadota bacterium]